MNLMHEAPGRPDADVLREVVDRLEQDGRCRDARVGVAVDDDVVSLTGEVASLAIKRDLEHAVHRVAGVRAVASELVAVRPEAHARDDHDLARAAASALRAHDGLPCGAIEITVSHGVVELEGRVDWPFQRERIEQAIAELPGVRRVDNRIRLVERVRAWDVRRALGAELQRRAARVARGIRVDVDDNRATLTGRVRSPEERDAAERAAWSVHGVLEVRNGLEVVS